MPMWNAPASARAPPSTSIRPTISSASPRSCRALSGACATAPRPTRTRRRAPRWCARSPPRPGSSRARGGRNEQEVKSFALALGAGGARGLAHIAIVEALDEMGVAPVAIAGVSIGAVIGAGYAAGLSGRAMRRHLLNLAHDPGEVWRRVTSARAVPWSQLLGAGFGNPFAVDAGKFYDAFLGDML